MYDHIPVAVIAIVPTPFAAIFMVTISDDPIEFDTSGDTGATLISRVGYVELQLPYI